MTQLRTVQVLGGGSTGSGAHVRSLAAGLVARGVRVTVCAPAELDAVYDFHGAGARHVPVPRRSDPVSVAMLRAALAGADVVHAHGLHAAARTALALGPVRGAGRMPAPLVVTWHSRVLEDGPRGALVRLFERRALRTASVVFATCPELVDEARGSGARDVRLSPLATPATHVAEAGPESKVRAELGAVGRPLVLAVGSLVPHRGYEVLLDAAALWRGCDPLPLIVVAGEGRERARLRRRVLDEELPVELLGTRDDVPDLVAAADAVVLPSRWEARPVLAQEALRLGVPLVATAVGGVPELVGDAAELVPYGDPLALASALMDVVTDPARRRHLAAAGRAQAATWPTEDDTVAQTLSVYDELTRFDPAARQAPPPRAAQEV